MNTSARLRRSKANRLTGPDPWAAFRAVWARSAAGPSPLGSCSRTTPSLALMTLMPDPCIAAVHVPSGSDGTSMASTGRRRR